MSGMMQKRKPKKLNCNIWIIGIIVALCTALCSSYVF